VQVCLLLDDILLFFYFVNVIMPAIFLVPFSTKLDLILYIFQIVEFISVLLTIGSETAEKELVRQSAIKRSIDLFFE
jgi:hypothetical protein